MDDTEQFLAINLLCASDASDPTFVSYNGSALQLEWKTPVACGESTGPGDDNKDGGNKDGGDEPASESVGSGIGWFFLAYALSRPSGLHRILNLLQSRPRILCILWYRRIL